MELIKDIIKDIIEHVCGGGVVSEPQALELTFDNIANVPVADASSVSDWNTFFDLPTYGTPFTSVEVDGDVVKLYGATSIILTGTLVFDWNLHLVSLIDNCSCITQVKENAFGHDAGTWMDKLTAIRLPGCTSILEDGFIYTMTLTEIYIPSCTTLGSTTGENFIFQNNVGLIITLTIPAALMTCNSGNPDGDIQYLQANNTVTIIQV